MSVGDEVRNWLADNWTEGADPREFRNRAVDAGWAAPTWDTANFGRGLSDADAAVVGEEFARVGAPGREDLNNLHARAIKELGGEELKARYLRGLLVGEVTGCLLYSEPGAGSDLASLRTSARWDTDHWRINGQKVWTSGARTATYGLLAARTNVDVPKHAGITMFALPMDQAGVEVRPIHQITGDAHFSEVFLTDAIAADADRIGPVDGGWAVLVKALGFERSVMGVRGVGSRAKRDPRFVGTEDDLLDLANRRGKLDDSAAITALADVYAARLAIRTNTARYAEEGRGTEPAALSMGKLAMSRLLHQTARIRRDLVGSDVLIDDFANAFADATLANFFTLDAYFTSIGGGTDQIQRNIVSERILGLPKEIDLSSTGPVRPDGP